MTKKYMSCHIGPQTLMYQLALRPLWTGISVSVPSAFGTSSFCARIATSITAALFYSLSATMSGWLASSCLTIWNLRSHRILALLFSTTVGHRDHCDEGTFSDDLEHTFLDTFPTTQFCLLLPATAASVGLFQGHLCRVIDSHLLW